MSNLLGKRLGPYEIVSVIGAGGMGEVYRAKDTRLDRVIAIKVLPARFADHPELRERFEREARTIGSLNHPHICTLHDIGRQDGIDYLVLELLEGETLAQRLAKGPLPLDHALQYAIDIADALDKAHRKGVVHRDLKPGNIMLTKSGAKLLDFGLAKLQQEGSSAAPGPLSQLPTATHPITAQGTILGTLQYMAPEQLEGHEADARTDIFALGLVLYEMATGKRAFEGKSQANLIAAILEREPQPISSLQPMTPLALDRIVKTCLKKDPDERWQSAGDLRRELMWIAEGGTDTGASASGSLAQARRGPNRRALIFSLGALLIGAAISSVTAWMLRPAPAARPVTRFFISLPPGQRFGDMDRPVLALSSDGRRLVYVAVQGAVPQLYLRDLNSAEAKPILGTDGASNPFFSPDNQWLAFFSGSKLKKVSLNDGTVLTLATDASLLQRGASWGSQGKIIFANTRGGLLQISDAGGVAQPLEDRARIGFGKRWPEFLPDGKAVLFTTGAPTATGQIGVELLGSGERRDLLQIHGLTQPHYAASGHLVYGLYGPAGNLMAVRFNPEKLEIVGAAVPVTEGVRIAGVTGASQFTISSTGTLAYIAGVGQTEQSRLVWVDRKGKEQALAAPAQFYETPRLSPDGQRVAVSIEGQVWIYDLSRETLTRFTFEGNTNNRPVWTPDGKRIAFYSDKEGPVNVFWQLADGSGGLERLTTSELIHVPTSFSPDGQLLAFHEANPTTANDIWVLHLPDRKLELFLRTPFDEGAPRFSPDGRWIAYISNESGRYEIYVQPYPGPGGKWQISTEGGREPVWNPSGRELFYRDGKKMMAVDIATKPAFAASKPRILFEGAYLASGLPIFSYDVSLDGQRFLMIKPVEPEQVAPAQINVVLNWFEELKQKFPADK